MRVKIYIFLGLILVLHFIAFTCIIGATEKSSVQPLISGNIPYENRKAVQSLILDQILEKYSHNKTFYEMHKFMSLEFQVLKINKPPEQPELLIKETFAKSQSVFERTEPFVGHSFHDLYKPESFEQLVNKYLWLKGLCFLVLGIKEDHKIGVAYFYQPENTIIRQQIIRDIVHFSFPEVVDTPENNVWFVNMSAVMDRLGYKIFNVDKYCPNKPTLLSSL